MYWGYTFNDNYISDEDKPQPIKDFIEESVRSLDKPFLIHVLNTLNPEGNMLDVVNDLIDRRSDYYSSGENYRYQDHSFVDFKDFVAALTNKYVETTGIQYALRLYYSDTILNYEDDCGYTDSYFVRYEEGKEMSYNSAGFSVFGYTEFPQPIPVTKEEIQEALDELNLNISEVKHNLQFSPKVIQRILDGEETFYAHVIDAYSDEINRLVEQKAPILHQNTLFLSIKDSERYIYDELIKHLPMDYHMDNMTCNSVIYLKDTAPPVYFDGNDVQIRPDSSVDWLANQLDNSNTFMSALPRELKYFAPEDEFLVAFPIKKTIRELLQYNVDGKELKIPAETRCGLFNGYTGDAGNFAIPISRDIEIPNGKAMIIADGAAGTYSLEDLIGKAIFKKPVRKSLYEAR